MQIYADFEGDLLLSTYSAWFELVILHGDIS